jgi:hypothetical protein
MYFSDLLRVCSLRCNAARQADPAAVTAAPALAQQLRVQPAAGPDTTILTRTTRSDSKGNQSPFCQTFIAFCYVVVTMVVTS